MINDFFVKIKSIYRDDIVFFIILFFLLSITDLYNNVVNTQYLKCFYNVVNAFVLSSFASIILSYIDKYKKLRKSLNLIIVILITLYSVVNIYSISLMLSPLNHGVIELLISTNYNETLEFIKAYITIFHVLLIIIVFTLIIRFSCIKCQVNNKFVVNLLSVVFLFCTILVI